MAFTDDFTGAAGQLLSARPGWTLVLGQDCLSIDSSGRLTKAGSTTATMNAYFRPDDASTAQRVAADHLGGTSTGVIAMATLPGGTLDCYLLRPLTGGNGARVYRINAGTIEASPVLSTAATGTNASSMELRATVSGGNVVLEIWLAGVQVATTTDSSASKKTNGRRGVLVNTTGSAQPALDNFIDSSIVSGAIAITAPAMPFREGVRQAGGVPVVGTYTGSPASIEARLVDAGGAAIAGFDWSTKVASPTGGAYSFAFANVPVGGPYRVQVRDSAVPGTVTTGSVDRYVGAIVFLWGQSQCEKLFTTGAGVLGVTAGAKVFQLRLADQNNPGVPTLAPVGAASGSGVVAIANQWAADAPTTPLLIVSCNYSGTSIDQWISETGQRPAMAAGWYLWPGLATTMLQATEGQASAVVFMQGTANVGRETEYAAQMDQLRDKFLTLLPGQSPLFGVVPHQRSNDGPKTWALRAVQATKAISGNPWRLLAWLLDWQMDGDASPHQLGTATGNPRGGTRIGRGLVRLLVTPALDRDGPQIVSASFTDASRTAIDVTFDRDIRTPAGATSGLPGWSTSPDGSTWPGLANLTGAIVSARVLRLTSTGGALPAGSRLDHSRGVPFSSDPATSATYAGPEADMEAGYLSKVLTDTSAFDGGRGMPASPVMGSGFAIAEAGAVQPVTITGSATVAGGNTLALSLTINPGASA